MHRNALTVLRFISLYKERQSVLGFMLKISLFPGSLCIPRFQTLVILSQERDYLASRGFHWCVSLCFCSMESWFQPRTQSAALSHFTWVNVIFSWYRNNKFQCFKRIFVLMALSGFSLCQRYLTPVWVGGDKWKIPDADKLGLVHTSWIFLKAKRYWTNCSVTVFLTRKLTFKWIKDQAL